MMTRSKYAVMALLRAIDILICAVWLAPLYMVGLASRPTGREMISTYVGEAAHNGHRWAYRAAAAIDWFFVLIGDKPDHCYRAFIEYHELDD